MISSCMWIVAERRARVRIATFLALTTTKHHSVIALVQIAFT